MSVLIVLLIAFIPVFPGCSINDAVLTILRPIFGLTSVNVIATGIHSKDMKAIAKKQSKSNVSFKFQESLSVTTQEISVPELVIFCSDSSGDLKQFLSLIDTNNLAVKKPIVIWTSSEKKEFVTSNIRIDQRVYHFNSDTGTMSETYTINKIAVTNILGHVDQRTASYIPTSEGLLTFESRRSNFHGYHIIAMTERDASTVIFDKSYQQLSIFHDGNKTFDVTQFSSGSYINFLNMLAKDFNFTYSLYKREDGKWGGIDKNGNVYGMMGNLVDGSAEMIVTTLTMNLWRKEYVDFLPIMTSFKYAIIIRSEGIEVFTWTTFIKPFTAGLWIALLGMATVIACWLYLSNKNTQKVFLYQTIHSCYVSVFCPSVPTSLNYLVGSGSQ